MKRQLSHSYLDIMSLENLCLAWQEFVIGKISKPDVQLFGRNLMDNIVDLQEDLVNRTYWHGGYESFYINDPKRRHIHKASVRDRLLHHAVYRILYPFFDHTFIADSYSCRDNKGTHKAINRFRGMVYTVSKNNTRTSWVLKCDIRKFFASIDQTILLSILKEYIPDPNIIWLLENIIVSFNTEFLPGVGLPLGNLTSQLLANVYMNRFDQWVKRTLKAQFYIRYADDFIFLSHDKSYLQNIVPQVQKFLGDNLKLSLHADKLFLKTAASGVDFLGWVNFLDHRLLRAKTKRRMMRKMRSTVNEQNYNSYVGLITHGNTVQLQQQLANEYWFWR